MFDAGFSNFQATVAVVLGVAAGSRPPLLINKA